MNDKDWTRVGPVTVRLLDALHFTGRELHFADLETAIAKIGGRRTFVFVGAFGWRMAPSCGGNIDHAVFFDELGMQIPRWRVAIAETNVRGRWKSPPVRFRDGPLSRIGSKRSGGHFYRLPRTRQELTAAAAHDADSEAVALAGRWRARRNRANLTTAWDDVPCGRRGRNWKNFRKHQWKD